MQLNKKKGQIQSISSKLALATCTLLQTAGHGVQAATDNSDEWKIDTDVLFYSESDGRVSLMEPVVSAEKALSDDETISIKLVYDVLTGATPNGALPDANAQTFTTPSGNKPYTTPANETPLNDTFRDNRFAAAVDWTQSIDRLSRMVWGGSLSSEVDFLSLGASATYMRDYNNRNSTLSLGLGFTSDQWDPIGGINTEFAYMIDANSSTAQPKGGTDSKTTSDVLVGWTQVINRSTLMQFNLGFSNSSGYLTDPYKIISVVDTNGDPASTGLPTDALPYVYEKRPDSRSRNTFYWKMAHHLDEDVINLSYRYFTDDWGINSHTLDFHYRYELGDGSYLQPHVRYYSQTAADFYRHSLTIGEALPDYASNDYRLGEFVSTTLGLKYAMPVAENSEFSVRVETMTQSYSTVGTLLGQQNTLDITPDLNAIIVQLGYSFYW